MAYHLTYTAEFTGYQSLRMELMIYRKDIEPAQVVELTVRTIFEESGMDGSESKFDTIISKKLLVTFFAKYGVSDITGETFLTDYYDEWKVELYCETINVFTGFIEPSGGNYPFKDKGYDVTIACTDGLGLLKGLPLTDINDNEYSGRHTLISYIAGCLAKTGLDLQIQTFCSLFHTTMYSRTNGLGYDMFSQARLHHRTFLKNVNEFDDCYTVLQKILFGFSLYQWNGRWVISYRGELQGSIGPTNYYCIYTHEGVLYTGGQDLGTQISVGKNQGVEPVRADQIVGYNFPLRSVKTEYIYEVPDNLVNNQRLQDFGDFISPLSTSESRAWQLVGWAQFHKYAAGVNGPETPISNKLSYIRQEVNAYNYELDRYMVLPHDPASQFGPQVRNYIRNLNDDFFVEKGDKLKITVDLRLANAQADADLFYMMVLLLVAGGNPGDPADWRTLREDGNWSGSGASLNYTAGRLNTVGQDVDITQWQTDGPEETTIPLSGSLFICLGTGGVANGNEIHFKNITIDHSSYSAQDQRNSIKGDYWQTEQNKPILESRTDRVYISDSSRRIHKGALFTPDGSLLTTPTWYRYGEYESKHYKELINLAVYRHNYRRFKRITGTFRGVLVGSENNPTGFYPLCFHKHFRFVDDSPRLYVLVPPLRIDYVQGLFEGIFVEAFNSGDYSQSGDKHEFKYNF